MIPAHKIKVIDCIGAVVGLVIITPAAGYVNKPSNMLDFFKH